MSFFSICGQRILCTRLVTGTTCTVVLCVIFVFSNIFYQFITSALSSIMWIMLKKCHINQIFFYILYFKTNEGEPWHSCALMTDWSWVQIRKQPLCICKGKAAYNDHSPYLRIARNLQALGYAFFFIF